MHLPLIGRRQVPLAPTGRCPAPTDSTTPHEALLESVCVRERAALARLEAATGGVSLCSLSRGGTPVPAVKYHEGASAALAEARRAVKRVAQGTGEPLEAHTVLLEIRDRWRSQRSTPGRAGSSWAGYLTGGLDALDELVGGDVRLIDQGDRPA